MFGDKLITRSVTSNYLKIIEQRKIIEWTEYREYTELTIPSGEIWMSESELVDLFGVFIPKLRNTIQILYKEELVRPYETERTIRQGQSAGN